MTTGRKLTVVAAALVVILAAVLGMEQIQARQDFRAALDFPAAARAQVSITRRIDGQEQTLDNLEHNSLKTAQIEALFDSLRGEAKYGGIGSASSPTFCEYEVHISGPDGYYRVFSLGKDLKYNYIYADLPGSSPSLKLKETPETLALLDRFFS